MKIINLLIGLFFGVWAIGTLILGIVDLNSPLSSGAGVTSVGATLGATAMLGLVSLWSFQNAFGKSQPVSS